MKLFKKKTLLLSTPISGEVKPIEEAPDQVFSQKLLGDGVMITPTDGQLVAPCHATITMVFPTKHAIGLTLDNGCELLLHFGIDTVELNGEGFELLVKGGDVVNSGDLLLRADLNYLKNNAKSEALMVVFTAIPDELTIEKYYGSLEQGERLIEIRG